MSCSTTTKEELYGPPPAYAAVDEHLPPPYISTISNCIDASPRRETSVELSSKLMYYLIIIGILHLIIGSVVIFCNIRLVILSEPFCYVGFWTGLVDLSFSTYLMFFISKSRCSSKSVRQFRFVHIVLSLITLSALILSSVNLSKDYSYHWYTQSSSIYNYKILLLALFTFSFLQICFSSFLAFLHFRY